MWQSTQDKNENESVMTQKWNKVESPLRSNEDTRIFV